MKGKYPGVLTTKSIQEFNNIKEKIYLYYVHHETILKIQTFPKLFNIQFFFKFCSRVTHEHMILRFIQIF